MKLLLFLIIFQSLLEINILNKPFISFLSQIKLKISGTGNIDILYSEFNKSYGSYFPDEIYLNQSKIENMNSTIYLSQRDNIITLKWNKTLQSCYRMFYNCKNIVEIDLSSFNSTNIRSMKEMFYGC